MFSISVKKSLLPHKPKWFKSCFLLHPIQPSPSTYPLMKCIFNSEGNIVSFGKVNVKDLFGTQPLSTKSVHSFLL